MEIQDFIQSKQIEKHQQQLCEALRKIYNSQKPSEELSRENAHLGLLFLNAFDKELETNSEYYYHHRSIYSQTITQGDKRYLQFAAIADGISFWEGTRFQLLEYIFGKTLAPLVRDAWHRVPQLMYQTGYMRRSFRAPNINEITFTQQINFIISLIDENSFELSLEERIIYSNYIYAQHFAHLIASALNNGRQNIKELVLDIIYNRHEHAKVSTLLIKGALLSDDQEVWEAIGKLLLSAQRQEGLRQVILEQLDETSIGAMKYLIDLIVEHKLTRFSSVIRALDVWAGLGWEEQRESTVNKFLLFAQKFLNNPEHIEKAVLSKNNSEVYMALWAQGVFDIEKCHSLLEMLTKNTTQEKVLLAMHFANEAQISALSLPLGLEFINHEAPIVYCKAIQLLDNSLFIKKLNEEKKSQLFELLESKLEELPKKAKTVEGKVFSWLNFSYSKEIALELMITLLNFKKDEDLQKITPYFSDMPLNLRERISREVLSDYQYYEYNRNVNKEQLPPLTKFQRDFAFKTLKDRGEYVRSAAMNALEYAEIEESEMGIFEDMLKSKSASTRNSIINVILKKETAQIQNSGLRLLTAKSQDQRLAGLDLLVNLKETHEAWVNEQAIAFSARTSITKKEEIILETLLPNSSASEEYSPGNGFGLFNPLNIAPIPATAPVNITVEYTGKVQQNQYGLSMPLEKVREALSELADIYTSHHDHEYTYEDWDGSQQTTLLGNQFAPIKRFKESDGEISAMQHFQNLPLYEVWQKWFEDSALTNSDLFLIMLSNDNVLNDSSKSSWKKSIDAFQAFTFKSNIPQTSKYHWDNPLINILSALSYLHPYKQASAFMEGLFGRLIVSIHPSEFYQYKIVQQHYEKEKVTTWRNLRTIDNIYTAYKTAFNDASDEDFKRFWALEYFYQMAFSEEIDTSMLSQSSLSNYARAHSLKLISKDQLFQRVLQEEPLRVLTQPRRNRKEEDDIRDRYPILEELVAVAIPRLLEIELKRSDSETKVSHLVNKLGKIKGVDYLIQILQALGKDKLQRGYSYYSSSFSKKEQLSNLLKNCYPKTTDDQTVFNKVAKEAKIKTERWVEVAMYAPQWIDFVANYLGWKEMKSAVWWLHAHTNGYHNAQTEAEFAKYSNIEATDFQQGAVDMKWFKDIYKSLGKSKWEMLYKSAKYISEGNGHTRALLYADVILGNKKITEVTKRVKEKRNQDYLRVYGLVPLSKNNRDKDLLKRYQFIQQFKKESKQFGSQRQESERSAARIALENLARTASYSDPIRLQWAMETEEAQQIIKDNPLITFENVEIWLEIDEYGQSSIKVKKEDKKLQAIPAKYRKDKAVVEMKKANKTLREQYRRTRKSLEMAMINGDEFLQSEIKVLNTHPIVAPLLKKLVFISEGNLGFISGNKLLSPDDQQHHIGETARVAHCTDLHQAHSWSEYQRYCFENELKQPFKQIFRELYVPTADELHEKTISRRYASHQVQTNKTAVLLKGQGWTVNYEEGLQKVFHQQGVIAQMFAMADWFSPAEIEAPTLETIQFFDRKTHKAIAFEQLDARIFSEVMRDLDLAVSVAHVGDTDPEASQSTIELRTVIVEETARLFKLQNVTLSERHAKIKGDLGEYSVHLGSGVSHKMPGVYLSILPVHSQRRGRMFLPFLDEDPKTAEIMSKILLLAKDKEIQDPTVLRQL